jgi:aminopeptidase N
VKIGRRIFIWLVLAFNLVMAQGKEHALARTQPLARAISASNPIDVLSYDAVLSLSPGVQDLVGQVRLRLRVVEPANSFYLDLMRMQVDSVVNSSLPLTYRYINNQIQFQAARNIAPTDTVAFTIYYHGQPGNDGHGGMFFTGRFAFTVGQGTNTDPPSMTRYWLPCHDEPFDKALWSVRIKIARNLLAVTNGRLLKVRDDGQHLTFNWQERDPISPYLMAIAVGDFATWQDSVRSMTGQTIPLHYYVYLEHLDQARYDWRRVGEMITFFESRFGAYPLQSYGMVELPMRGAMEHQTMTSFSNLLVSGNGQYEPIVAHELAHQWWGDWVTVADWRDLWLNEGFASYAETLWEEHLHGASGLQTYMEGFRATFLQELGRYGAFSIYDPKYSWGATVYEKGAWVLHMLRFLLGDEKFFASLREYGRTHSYGSAITEDFIMTAEAISGQDLTWFFKQWIYEAGLPEWEARWQSERTGPSQCRLELTVEQKQQKVPLFRTPVEVLLQLSDKAILDTVWIANQSERFVWYTASQPLGVTLDPHGWVLKKLNINGTALPPGLQPGLTGVTESYPNPFAPDVQEHMHWLLQLVNKDTPAAVRFIIYDVAGKRVRTVYDKKCTPGLYTVTWDGRNEQDQKVAAGVYVCRIRISGQDFTRKITVVE